MYKLSRRAGRITSRCISLERHFFFPAVTHHIRCSRFLDHSPRRAVVYKERILISPYRIRDICNVRVVRRHANRREVYISATLVAFICNQLIAVDHCLYAPVGVLATDIRIGCTGVDSSAMERAALIRETGLPVFKVTPGHCRWY